MNRTVSVKDFAEVVVALLPFFWRWDEHRLGRTLTPAERKFHAGRGQQSLENYRRKHPGVSPLYDLALFFPERAERTVYLTLDAANLESQAFNIPAAPKSRVKPTWRQVDDPDLRRRLEEAENTSMSTLREHMVRAVRVALAASPGAASDDLLESVNQARKALGATPFESANSCPDVLAMARARMGIAYGAAGRHRTWVVNRPRYVEGCKEIGVDPLALDAEDGFLWADVPDTTPKHFPVFVQETITVPTLTPAPTATKTFLPPMGNTPLVSGGVMADGSAPPPPKDRAPVVEPPPTIVPTLPVVTTPAVLPSDPVEAALATFKATLAAHGWCVASMKIDLERVERRTIGG